MKGRRTDERLDLIIEAARELGPGTRASARELALCALAGMEPEDLDDFFFETGLDRLDEELKRAFEERGLFLDVLHHTGPTLGLPYNLDLVVRRIANRKRGPIAIEDVEGVSFSSGGFFQGWREVVVLRETDGFEPRLAEGGPHDPVSRRSSLLSSEEIGLLEAALSECRVYEWEQDYMNWGVLDGEQWELQINLSGGDAIVCHGSNAYPPRFRAFQERMLEIGGFRAQA